MQHILLQCIAGVQAAVLSASPPWCLARGRSVSPGARHDVGDELQAMEEVVGSGDDDHRRSSGSARPARWPVSGGVGGAVDDQGVGGDGARGGLARASTWPAAVPTSARPLRRVAGLGELLRDARRLNVGAEREAGQRHRQVAEAALGLAITASRSSALRRGRRRVPALRPTPRKFGARPRGRKVRAAVSSPCWYACRQTAGADARPARCARGARVLDNRLDGAGRAVDGGVSSYVHRSCSPYQILRRWTTRPLIRCPG